MEKAAFGDSSGTSSTSGGTQQADFLPLGRGDDTVEPNQANLLNGFQPSVSKRKTSAHWRVYFDMHTLEN